MLHTMTQEKTGREMAAEYAEGIVEGVVTLDALADSIEVVLDYIEALDNCDPSGSDDTETLDAARTEAENACGGAAALGEVLALWRDLGRPSDASEVVSAWVDGVLDVEIHGLRTMHGWEVTEVSFLVTCGGPSARLVWDGSSTLAVFCSWSSEEIVRRVECDALAIYAEGLAE